MGAGRKEWRRVAKTTFFCFDDLLEKRISLNSDAGVCPAPRPSQATSLTQGETKGGRPKTRRNGSISSLALFGFVDPMSGRGEGVRLRAVHYACVDTSS